MSKNEFANTASAVERKGVFHPTKLWTARFLLISGGAQEVLNKLGASTPEDLEPRLALYWHHLTADAHTHLGNHNAASQRFEEGFTYNAAVKPAIQFAYFAGYAESQRVLFGLDASTTEVALEIIKDIKGQKEILNPRVYAVAYALNRTLALNASDLQEAQSFALAAQYFESRVLAERLDLPIDEAVITLAAGAKPENLDYSNSPLLSTIVDPIAS